VSDSGVLEIMHWRPALRSLARTKNTRHLRRVKFREEKCRESIAASKAYDIPTR